MKEGLNISLGMGPDSGTLTGGVSSFDGVNRAYHEGRAVSAYLSRREDLLHARKTASESSIGRGAEGVRGAAALIFFALADGFALAVLRDREAVLACGLDMFQGLV